MGHIFISYSHKDSDYVHKLQKTLQDEGFEAWIDDRIDYGDEWLKVIQKHLDECDAFIIVMSRNSFESEMVQNEVTRAREKRKPFFPLLLDGENWLIVQAKQYVDVRNGSLPTEKFYQRLETATPRNGKKKVLPPPVPLPPTKGFFDVLKEVFSKASPFIRITGFASVAIALLWGGSFIIPKFVSLIPTTRATETIMTQRPGVTNALATNTPNPPTNTPKLQATATKTVTPVPTALSIEIVDSKGLPMLLVPAGEFTMGFPADQANNFCQTFQKIPVGWTTPCRKENYLREEPVHKVQLNSYYIDTYEVSNGEYQKCAAEHICMPPAKTSANQYSNYYNNANLLNYPVLNVTWNMAKTYCEWRGARLPTEAEWEKAARGTDARTYPWANYNAAYKLYDPAFYVNKANLNVTGFSGPTRPVNSNSDGLSPYGLYNMSGNVWEWVADWYNETYYASSPSENPQGPSSGEYKVIRGGGINSPDGRTTARDYILPADFSVATGFRCAKDATP